MNTCMFIFLKTITHVNSSNLSSSFASETVMNHVTSGAATLTPKTSLSTPCVMLGGIFSSLAARTVDQPGFTFTAKNRLLSGSHELKLALDPPSLPWNLKMMVSSRNLLFQGLIFRFHVQLQGCSLAHFLYQCILKTCVVLYLCKMIMCFLK